MSIGEPFEGEQRILDWTRVRKTHILVLTSIFFFLIVLTFGLYSIYLIPDVMLLALFSLIFQTVLGMILTRVYHNKGSQSKSELSLIEPSSLDSEWIPEYVHVHNEEISRIFERMITNTEKIEGNPMDDTNDLAWFAVAVWSMATAVVVIVFGPITMMMFISSMVVSSILLGSYYFSYINSKNGNFSELLAHLEHYVITKTDFICDNCVCKTKKIAEWKVHIDEFVLSDFHVQFEIVDCKDIVFSYNLGLPENEKEGFVLCFMNNDQFQKLQSLLSKTNDISWNIEISEESQSIKINIDENTATFSNPLTFIRFNSLNQEITQVCDWIIESCKSKL